MYRTDDAFDLARALQAAVACATAAYEGVPLDVVEVVGDVNPLSVVWTISLLTKSVLDCFPPDKAREVLAMWGANVAACVAGHPGNPANQPADGQEPGAH